MKSKIVDLYSRFTDKDPSFCERVFRTIRNLLKKTVFEKRNADWFSELPSITIKYINTVHHSIKLTPVGDSKKANEEEVYFDLQHRRVRQQPKFKLGDLVRKADIKRVFSKGDSTNYSYNLYTITEFILDTIPSYRFEFLPERYN